MKRKFRIVSCYEDERCVSYSTFEKAEMALRNMALNNGHYFFQLAHENKPEDYNWYNPEEGHQVKCWHGYIACTTEDYFANKPKDEWAAYTIVEFN